MVKPGVNVAFIVENGAGSSFSSLTIRSDLKTINGVVRIADHNPCCWLTFYFTVPDSIEVRKLSTLLANASGSSTATNQRSRCGVVRSCPVLSSHFSPGAAPQVGQRRASIFLGVSAFCIKTAAS